MTCAVLAGVPQPLSLMVTGLRCGRAIDELEDDGVHLAIQAGERKHLGVLCCELRLDARGQHDVGSIGGQHPLDVVGTAAHDAGVVETDEVHRPRDVANVEQERRVGTHRDHVAVALQAEQERRLRERRRQVAFADAAVAAVFAHINPSGRRGPPCRIDHER